MFLKPGRPWWDYPIFKGRPPMVWKNDHRIGAELLKRAEAEDWTIAQLCEEFLKVGLVPIIEFAPVENVSET